MSQARVYCDSLEISMDSGPDISDITGKLATLVKRSGIEEGTLCASVVGSTGSLTSIEYEPGVVEDLRQAIIRLAPPDMPYAHERAWHDGNGHSHVQAALLGPSITLAIRGGALSLGTWQQVVVINHDIHSRKRRIEVTLVGV